jgi:F-type H+-transporting ATPase subunit b
MLIDWFTVIAQVVNFLILVYLLKRFLYKPILEAIDAREKRVAAQLQEAADQKKEAEDQHQKFQQLHEELDKNKESLIAAAKKEAETEHQRLLESARKEYDELRSHLQESLKKEQASLSRDLKQRVQGEVFEIARKALADLANISLEAQIINVFIQKIQALNSKEKEQLIAAIKPTDGPLTVRSAFELTKEQQAKIEETIQNQFGTATKLEFITATEEISGIELSANGFKIAWSIAEYLHSLEKRINGLTDGLHNNQPELEKSIHES